MEFYFEAFASCMLGLYSFSGHLQKIDRATLTVSTACLRSVRWLILSDRRKQERKGMLLCRHRGMNMCPNVEFLP